MREKRYNSIDVCKFVMAILVVSLHTRPLEYCVNPVVQGIYENVAACAVPFFFISSGFLLGVKLKMPYDCEDNFKVVWRYLMKIVKLYIIWTIVYLPLAIYDYVSQSASWGKSILLFVRGFFFVGEHYNSWILWYLLSTIYALILFFVLLKKHFPLHVIVCIGFALILFGFGIDSFVQYESMLPGILFYLRKALRYSIGNGRIFRGMFYIPLGAFLTQKMLPANWGGYFAS